MRVKMMGFLFQLLDFLFGNGVGGDLVLEFLVSKVQNDFLAKDVDIDKVEAEYRVYFMGDSRLNETDFDCKASRLVTEELSRTKTKLPKLLMLHFYFFKVL